MELVCIASSIYRIYVVSGFFFGEVCLSFEKGDKPIAASPSRGRNGLSDDAGVADCCPVPLQIPALLGASTSSDLVSSFCKSRPAPEPVQVSCRWKSGSFARSPHEKLGGNTLPLSTGMCHVFEMFSAKTRG